MKIEGLGNYYLYHASIGEVYYELDRKTEARQYFEKASTLTSSNQERQLIREKIAKCL